MTTEDVYELVRLLIEKSLRNNDNVLAGKLNDAIQLGSSGLEILGAIRNVFISESNKINRLIDRKKTKEVIQFVDKIYKQ